MPALCTLVRSHCRGVQVSDLASAGELIKVGGDPVEDRPHPREVDADGGGVRPVSSRPQVDDGRLAASLKLGQPLRALSQPPSSASASSTTTWNDRIGACGCGLRCREGGCSPTGEVVCRSRLGGLLNEDSRQAA